MCHFCVLFLCPLPKAYEAGSFKEEDLEEEEDRQVSLEPQLCIFKRISFDNQNLISDNDVFIYNWHHLAYLLLNAARNNNDYQNHFCITQNIGMQM